MTRRFGTALALALILSACGTSGSTAPPAPTVNETRMTTFVLRLEPIGDITNSTFNEYTNGTATGFASIFLEQTLQRSTAKDNASVIDLVYLLNPLSTLSGSGKISFYNPAIFNQNFGTLVSLGWPSYSDGPKFVKQLRSTRSDPVTGANLVLSEAEFDGVATPIDIKDIINRSLTFGGTKTSTYQADYVAGKIDGVQIFGIVDSKGFSSLIKILPGVNVFGLNVTVKRGYAIN
jgi:hypothetical protein